MNQNRIPGKRLILFSGNWREVSRIGMCRTSRGPSEEGEEQVRTRNAARCSGTYLEAQQSRFDPVYALLADERWLVRHSAIQSLKRTSSPQVEDVILHVLETTNDPYDLVYCQATLNQIGSAKAIPSIAKNLNSRKRDVKDSARLAIEAIEARERRNAPR